MFTLTASVCIAAVLATSCNSSAEKVEKAQEELIEANRELTKANEAYLADVEKYRLKVAEKIASNEKSAAAFKARIETEKREVRADYSKKIAELEAKNSDLKMKMDEYKADSKDSWEDFKTDFSREMDELGEAFVDLVTTDKK